MTDVCKQSAKSKGIMSLISIMNFVPFFRCLERSPSGKTKKNVKSYDVLLI